MKLFSEYPECRAGNLHPGKVLIDKKENGYFVGRTEFDTIEVDNKVLIDASIHYFRVGDFVTLRVNDATEFDLYGVAM